jgi:hypothetical protein
MFVKANKKGKEWEREEATDGPGKYVPPTVRGQIKRMQMHVVQAASEQRFPL